MNTNDVSDGSKVRSRKAYAVALAGVIGFGLASRSDAVGFPWLIAKYSGDLLWGLAAFVGFGFLFPRLSTTRLASLAIGFARAVEFGQLFHPRWLDAIRATRVGGLVLGTPSATFAWWDIAAYLVGITFGAIAELLRLWRTSKRPG